MNEGTKKKEREKNQTVFLLFVSYVTDINFNHSESFADPADAAVIPILHPLQAEYFVCGVVM